MSNQPIRWDNIGGPSPAEASRPLELAQRSFNGLFDGLRDVVKERETIDTKNWEAGKTNNTNAFLDHLATYQKPEDLKAAIESGKLAEFKGQFGNQIDPVAVRAAAEQRLTALMNNAKQGWEFNNAQRDQNEAGLIDSIKAKLASNDPAIRAQGIQEAQAAQVRQKAALVQTATDADRAGVRWDEDKKQFVRNEGLYKNTLEDSRVRRIVEQQNANSQRISAEASRTSAGASVSNAETNRNQFLLSTLREQRNIAQEDAENQAKITKELATVRGVSMTSPEGQEAINKKIKELPPNLQEMAPDLLMKFNKTPGATATTVVNGLSMLQQSWLKFNSGDIDTAYKAAMANTVGSDQQEKLNKLRAGRLVEQSETSTNTTAALSRELERLRGVKQPGDGTVTPSAVRRDPSVVLKNNTFPSETPGTPEYAAMDTALQAAEAEERRNAPKVDPLQAAKTRLEEARAAGQGKGYYSPEMSAWRQAESAYNDISKARAEQVQQAQSKLANSEAVVKSLEAQVRSWTKSNAGKEPPKALLDVLATHKSDLEVLRARAEEAKKLAVR